MKALAALLFWLLSAGGVAPTCENAVVGPVAAMCAVAPPPPGEEETVSVDPLVRADPRGDRNARDESTRISNGF